MPSDPYTEEDLKYIENNILYLRFIESEKLRETMISDKESRQERQNQHPSQTFTVPPSFNYGKDGRFNPIARNIPSDYTPPIPDTPSPFEATPFFISGNETGWTDEDFEGPTWN